MCKNLINVNDTNILCHSINDKKIVNSNVLTSKRFYTPLLNFLHYIYIFAVDQPTVRCLLTELDQVVDWYSLGIHLEIKPTELQEIQRNFPSDCNRCKIEMLSSWLKSCSQPTWDKVAQAALDAKEENVAKAIRQKHCKFASNSSASNGILHFVVECGQYNVLYVCIYVFYTELGGWTESRKGACVYMCNNCVVSLA